jgi:hypothetical protein
MLKDIFELFLKFGKKFQTFIEFATENFIVAPKKG